MFSFNLQHVIDICYETLLVVGSTTKNPSVDILDALCNALGISSKEFFDTNAELKDTDDSLLKEIALLTPNQRENLRIFLNSIRD